jgi:acetylornithine deacetylase/succinyl-diaminopimelate desuccinylase-like protein
MDRIIVNHVDRYLKKYLEQLRMLIRKPSVTFHREDCGSCAEFLKELMIGAGMTTRLIPVENGNPLLLGEVEGEGERILLVYTHYDVQAPEPIEKWTSPPFEARVENGRIVSRGASDSKGNLMAFISAIEAYQASKRKLPLRIKFLFEGEEEAGSPDLPAFVEANKSQLSASGVVCFDSDTHPSGRPTIELGLKGILSVELRCREASTDLHSMWAPIVENAAWRLVQALSTLRASNGRIAIEGWYDEYRQPSLEELKTLESVPFDEEQLCREFGVNQLAGNLRGRDALKALVFEPTANISGLDSGYSGPGGKTLLPASAFARMDFRLMPDQEPKRLLGNLQEHLHRHGFDDVEVSPLGFLEPSKTPSTAPIAKAVAKAAEETYGATPVIFPNSPGSGPDYLFTRRLNLHSVWTGCSPPFSNAHAPNEFTTVDAYRKGILFAAAIIDEFSRVDIDPKKEMKIA